ncbi:MAG: hypothetical protein ACJ76H_10610 [Bacteriovoracaceae bacterium]
MEVLSLGKKIACQLLVMIYVLTSCNPMAAPQSKRKFASLADGSISTTGGSSSGTTSGTDGDNSVGDGTILPPKVEIRNLIEPNLSYDPNYQTGTGYSSGGSYVRKLTLPKNFAGKLYVAGINIGTLNNRIVRVKFKWGLNQKAIPEEGIPATVIQAPGITPQTPISVLVLDLRGEPFRAVRLPYDLFDYNDYDFSAGDTPVQDNRDTGLYCRGLQVGDDPTFVGVGACDGLQSNPDQPDEECLYAYAKVADQGLVRQTSATAAKVPMTPTLTQTNSFVGTSYYQDYLAKSILKPLPDTIATSSSYTSSTFLFSQSNATTASPALSFAAGTIWDPIVAAATTYPKYYYRGPYRLMDSTNWQFRFQRLDGPHRLFKENSYVNFDLSKGAVVDNPVTTSVDSDGNVTYSPIDKIYYNSYLFPLATKIKIGAGVGYLGSSTPDGSRSVTSLSSAGDTLWMDGSNARAQSKDSEMNHVGSCNVTSSIEITAKDDNGVEYTISSAFDVKLQLVRPTVYRTDIGNEVLYSNFRSCSSNASCGASECCLNNRCWDDSLVSQCFDDTDTQGNKSVGSSCGSDLECSSLCCSPTNGQCAPHNTTSTPQVLCSKPVGSFCIAKDWCAKTPITKCIVVSQPNDPVTGEARCTQSCYTVYEYGDCKNSACVPAIQPPIPVFNPADPNRCANAQPAPDFSN